MTTLEIAKRYVAAGLSVVPVLPDGTKKPVYAWKEYQSRLPTSAELHMWFAGEPRFGIAIICGMVSGGLEVLDFDAAEAFDEWQACLGKESPGFLDSLPQVQTPNGGRHVYFRTPAPLGNQKLARNKDGKTRIETRGEGGYVLAPGSPPQCHPTGRTYQHIAGPDVTNAPMLGVE